MTQADKKRQEEIQIREFLFASQVDADTWVIEHRERPDFLARSPTGATYGLELTELLTPCQGKDRAADSRLASVIRETIQAFLIAKGGSGGASVYGTTRVLPSSEELRSDLGRGLRDHLGAYGSPLDRNNGVMERVYRHEFYVIEYVRRFDDIDRVMLNDAGWQPPLAHKAGRPAEDIEHSIAECVAAKVAKAGEYERRAPLWLVIRNPNQRLCLVSEACRSKTRDVNRGTFSRIVVMNLPLDRYDPRPPEPSLIDLV
jgi:hypothetical protein